MSKANRQHKLFEMKSRPPLSGFGHAARIRLSDLVNARMNKTKQLKIFELLRQNNPKPTTELNYRSTYQLLIAVILSAQATDISVNKATKTLYKIAPTPAGMVKLGVKGLKKYIQSIGLYNTKAVNVIKTSKLLLAKHSGEVPSTREELEALPGVGRKTANVVLNTAFGQPTIAVDTHIFRVANRTGIAPGKTVLMVEKGLLRRVPDEFKFDAHHWLILHGRYTCTARQPRCGECVILKYCEYKEKPANV